MLENQRVRARNTLLNTLGILVGAILLILLINWLLRGAFTRSAEHLARAEAAFVISNPALLDAWQQGDTDRLNVLLAGWTQTASSRMTVLDTEGNVIADSASIDVGAGNVANAAEVRQAMQQGYGRAIRTVQDGAGGQTGARTLFIAQTVQANDETLGVLRWGIPLTSPDQEVRALQWQVAAAILGAALLLIALMLWQVQRSARVIQRLSNLMERALQQDFDGHILNSTQGELGTLANVTNRLVDKYRKATKRRAREKDRLNTVLTHMSSGALILNEYGRVRLLNPAAATLLRTTPEAALRQSFVQVVQDHRIAEVWQRCQESMAEESEAIELGPDRFYRVTVTPFLGGNANGYLVMMQDLTVVRRLEKVRRDFISNVSHELRTPLTSIAALVDTLRDGALDDPPAAARFLDRMEVEVDKMAQMVQELLELSRIETGQIPLRLQPVRVDDLVQPALERLATQAERRQIALRSELAADLPPVVVDGERIQQVLINLIHNAIKFTPEGGSVVIAARAGGRTHSADNGTQDAPDSSRVTITVRDTGAGIPAADQARIFERFYKTDRSRSGGGTGLGLAIAKHTVQAHGGEIWVESREGTGSAFHFTLPVESASPADTTADDATADDTVTEEPETASPQPESSEE